MEKHVRSRIRPGVFTIFAVLSACAATYHAAGALGLLRGDESPWWRHAVFVAISVLGVWYFVRRPVALLPLFLLLTAQQFSSHGHRALTWWTRDARIDVISIVTLMALSVALVLLVLDARDRSPFVRKLVCPLDPPPHDLADA